MQAGINNTQTLVTHTHAHAHTCSRVVTHTLTHWRTHAHTRSHTQSITHKITKSHTQNHTKSHTHTHRNLLSQVSVTRRMVLSARVALPLLLPALQALLAPVHVMPALVTPALTSPAPLRPRAPPPTDMSPATLTVAELDKGAPLPTLGSQLQPPGRAPRPRGSRWHIRHALAGPSDPAGAEGRGPLPTEAGLAASKPGSGASSSLSGPLTAAAGPGGGGPPDPPAAGSSRSSDDDAGLGCREGRGRLGWPAGCKRPRRFRSRRADQVGGGMGGAVAAEPAPPVHIHAI